MGVGAGLYMCVVVVQKFTFAKFLCESAPPKKPLFPQCHRPIMAIFMFFFLVFMLFGFLVLFRYFSVMAALLFKYDTAINIAYAETLCRNWYCSFPNALNGIRNLTSSAWISNSSAHIQEDGACFYNVNLLIIIICSLDVNSGLGKMEHVPNILPGGKRIGEIHPRFNLSGATVCKTVLPVLSDRCASVTLVYRGETVLMD